MPHAPVPTRNILEIDYNPSSGSFVDVAQQIESLNRTRISQLHGDDLKTIESGLNLLYRLMGHYTWLMNATHIAILNPASRLLFSACHKNQVALYSALQLTRVGLHGPARSILRHVFEAQVIGKFCSLSPTSHLLERWMSGEVVYFGNAILKKIQAPNPEPIREFWSLMSDYSHATVYAQQVSMNYESSPNDVPLTLVYFRILLATQYHLLASHFITPSMTYYSRRYGKDDTEIPAIKKELRELIRDSATSMLAFPREIIRCYQAKWKLAPRD